MKENIKIRIESKFWEKLNKWCVAVYLPMDVYGGWFNSAWDKERAEAEKQVLDATKKHIDYVRETNKPTDIKEEVLNY